MRLLTGMPLTAENAWSSGNPAIGEIAYRPAEVFQDLWDGEPAEGSSYALIDLRNYANRTFADSDLQLGWLGLGAENDLSAMPTGRQWLAGIPFDVIPAGRKQCLVLGKDGDNERAFPVRAWQIPMNVKAKELAFLQTCSRPARFARHIYDRQRVNPGKIVRYVVHYADDERAEIALKWNVRISDWNSQLGSAYGRTGWQGKTASGAIARVEVLRWTNPRPEVKIRALDIVSLQSTVRPVVLGVTAVQ